MNRAIQVSWTDFDNCVNHIVSNWRRVTPQLLVAVIRGGLPLAAALSYRWDIPILATRVGHGDQAQFNLPEHTYYVEDAVGTGLTAKLLRNEVGREIPIISWFSHGTVTANMYYQRCEPDTWIIFPWEDPEKAMQEMREYERSRYSFERTR